jgi:hypothetical protein
VESLQASHFDLFVVRTLEGASSEDTKQMWDRMQAFRVIAKCMQVLAAGDLVGGDDGADGRTSSSSSCLHLFPRSFLMAMAALAKAKTVTAPVFMQADDPLRVPCLLALRQLLKPAAKACAACNVPKVVLDGILDPALPPRVADSLLLSLLSATQTALTTGGYAHPPHRSPSPASRSAPPAVRRYFRVDEDLQKLLSPFTDLDTAETPQSDPVFLRNGAKVTREERLRCAQRCVLLLGQSWAGLQLLASNPFGLRDVLRVLGDVS